ncbi:hypothetical protein RND71_040830 [Anisodus tanguticus]|uniref:Pentatricopeptide repeat-containing protein n=1 Tax=Anisodus tanguticus TaxID=243964 RepID=A0AAE1UPA7_9SOLA|nr:hypothetical protein RND71_040830 [Anisodus tanguticus]
MDAKLANSLVDMYLKSGNVTYAQRVFRLAVDKDSILYNSMIAGYALHGYENEATQLFSQMTERGFQPDEVTFLALLSVCRHRGLVKTGEEYFFSMTNDYKISPGTDHYASMIDLYGRANQLDKARISYCKSKEGTGLDTRSWLASMPRRGNGMRWEGTGLFVLSSQFVYASISFNLRLVSQKIALAIRDEIEDFEKASFDVIPNDDVSLERLAFEEVWKQFYLNWVVRCFRITTQVPFSQLVILVWNF